MARCFCLFDTGSNAYQADLKLSVEGDDLEFTLFLLASLQDWGYRRWPPDLVYGGRGSNQGPTLVFESLELPFV